MILKGGTTIASQEGGNETEDFDDGLNGLVLHIFWVEGIRHISTSAKVQKSFGTDKHRSPLGLASDLERIFAIFFYKLTKFGV